MSYVLEPISSGVIAEVSSHNLRNPDVVGVLKYVDNGKFSVVGELVVGDKSGGTSA